MKDIEKWLLEQPGDDEGFIKKNLHMKQEEIDRWFAKWIERFPEHRKQMLVQIIDRLVFHLSNFYHKRERRQTCENRIIVEARLFDSSIQSIDDMSRIPLHKLEYLEEKYKSTYSRYALIEGGIAGTGHPLGLSLDFPALLLINMNMIQHIAGTYGYSLRYPNEHILALKTLLAASYPNIYRKQSWEWLMDQYHEQDEYGLHVNENETLVQKQWLESLAKHWVKSLVLYGIRKQKKDRLPLLGIVMGANLNYQFTKQVAQFTSHFYQYRYMKESELPI